MKSPAYYLKINVYSKKGDKNDDLSCTCLLSENRIINIIYGYRICFMIFSVDILQDSGRFKRVAFLIIAHDI
jgi:hypothetical protein